MRLGLVIDLDTCVGCHACAVARKEWNVSGTTGPLSDYQPYGAEPSGAEAAGLGDALGPGRILAAGVFALALTAAGLTASMFHFNPKNAWRAFSRFKTSWPSREGVFAVLFFPFAAAYLGLTWLDMQGLEPVRLTAGALATVLAWATLFSTGMIYGCLKTSRQWNTPLVPANYLALAHFSGILLLLTAVPSGTLRYDGYLIVAVMLLLAAAALEAIYYFWIAGPGVGPTVSSATGFTRDRVTLFDSGHTHGTFLTREFGFQAARRRIRVLKGLVFAAAFAIPLLALVASGHGVSGTASGAAAFLGLLAERWLFFAEARHVVNLYHGIQ